MKKKEPPPRRDVSHYGRRQVPATPLRPGRGRGGTNSGRGGASAGRGGAKKTGQQLSKPRSGSEEGEGHPPGMTVLPDDSAETAAEAAQDVKSEQLAPTEAAAQADPPTTRPRSGTFTKYPHQTKAKTNESSNPASSSNKKTRKLSDNKESAQPIKAPKLNSGTAKSKAASTQSSDTQSAKSSSFTSNSVRAQSNSEGATQSKPSTSASKSATSQARVSDTESPSASARKTHATKHKDEPKEKRPRSLSSRTKENGSHSVEALSSQVKKSKDKHVNSLRSGPSRLPIRSMDSSPRSSPGSSPHPGSSPGVQKSKSSGAVSSLTMDLRKKLVFGMGEDEEDSVSVCSHMAVRGSVSNSTGDVSPSDIGK